MYEVKKETLEQAYKPYDVVSDEHGNVGFIQEVSVNESQSESKDQISYAVHWLIGDNTIHSWFDHDELEKHCNLFVEISKCSCNTFGSNEKHVEDLFRNIV